MQTDAGLVKVALLGTGDIATRHAAALKVVPGVELRSVCDLSLLKAKAFSKTFGVKGIYNSIDDLLDSQTIDVVHVLTDPGSHGPLAVRCIEGGADAFIEKPLAVSMKQCEELAQKSRAYGRLCAVNHQWVHSPVIQHLMREIQSFKFGGLRHVHMIFSVPAAHLRLLRPDHFIFNDSRNLFFEFGPHPFSLINLLLGRVRSAETSASGEIELMGQSLSDLWQTSLVCERGTASLTMNIGKTTRNITLDVIGEDAAAHIDLVRQSMEIRDPESEVVPGRLRSVLRRSHRDVSDALADLFHHYRSTLNSSKVLPHDPFQASLLDFYSARKAGRSPRQDIATGAAVVEYCEEAVANVRFSSRQARVVSYAG